VFANPLAFPVAVNPPSLIVCPDELANISAVMGKCEVRDAETLKLRKVHTSTEIWIVPLPVIVIAKAIKRASTNREFPRLVKRPSSSDEFTIGCYGEA